MALYIGFVVCLAFLTLGKGEGSCCVPEQWEGLEGLMAGFSYRRQDHLLQSGTRISFDSKSKKIVMSTTVLDEGKRHEGKILQDYNQHLQYTVFKDKCFKEKLEEFPSRCLPDDAKRLPDTYFGADENRLELLAYVMTREGASVYASFTKNCVPVSDVIYGERKGVDYLDAIGFSGITTGIKDAKVFDVPAVCQKEDPDFVNADPPTFIRKRTNFIGF